MILSLSVVGPRLHYASAAKSTCPQYKRPPVIGNGEVDMADLNIHRDVDLRGSAVPLGVGRAFANDLAELVPEDSRNPIKENPN
jgi:hypothetical protein